MAENTNTVKRAANKTNTKKIENEEIKEITEKKENKVERKYETTDTIITTSVTAGELIMIGKKTKNLYSWSDYGDCSEVEYQDLAAAKSSKDPYVFAPYFIIDDEELLESKGWEKVREVYQNMYSLEDIESIFDLDLNSFKKTIQNLPKGLVNTVKTMAAEKIENKTLDSINKISTLDEELGTDLKLYI